MKSINVNELKELKDSNADFVLIDVREIHENENAEMGGTLIPMGEISERFSEIPKDKKVIIHCRSGVRSANVISWLEQAHGYDNLHNLEGGIMAWAATYDPSLRV